MERSKEKIKADLALLEKALETLYLALKEPLTDFIRDATIQRFEYVFEISWKTVQVGSDHMGYVCNSPREAIKTAFKLGWITNPENWFDALEARNKTSHAYNLKLAREVYSVAKKFPKLVEELAASIKKLV